MEYIGNLRNILGTPWELDGNRVRTHWNTPKKKKTGSTFLNTKLELIRPNKTLKQGSKISLTKSIKLSPFGVLIKTPLF